MTSTRSGSGEEHQEAPSGSRKRAYEAPRILYREPLEAMAAICAPAPPAKSNFGFCPQGPISS